MATSTQKRISWLNSQIEWHKTHIPKLLDRAETWLAEGNEFMFDHCMKLADELCKDCDNLRGELLHMQMSGSDPGRWLNRPEFSRSI